MDFIKTKPILIHLILLVITWILLTFTYIFVKDESFKFTVMMSEVLFNLSIAFLSTLK